MEKDLAACPGQLRGGAEDPVAEPFRFPPPCLVVGEGEELHPGDQFAGEADEGAPDPVLVEVVEWQVRQAGAFEFRIRSSARALRRCRNSRSGSCPVRVLVARAVIRCPSTSVRRSWAPGCGLSFAGDHSHPHRPVRQIEQVGEFGDPGAVADGSVGVVGRCP